MSSKLVKLNHLFTLCSTKSKGIDNYDSGDVPFVTSTESNNGVVGYVEPEEDDLIFFGPAIAISGLGHATVHFEGFLPKGNGGDSLTILKPCEQTLAEKALKIWDQYVEVALSLLIFVVLIKIFNKSIVTLGKANNVLLVDSSNSESERIEDIENDLLKCEEEYSNLLMRGTTVEDLICFAAAFNTLHKWRFSYGRKCSINRLKNLEFPFPLPKVSHVWNSESSLVLSVNALVDTKLEQRIVSDAA